MKGPTLFRRTDRIETIRLFALLCDPDAPVRFVGSFPVCALQDRFA